MFGKILLLSLGLGALFYGVIEYKKLQQLKESCTATTTGTVSDIIHNVEYEESDDDDGFTSSRREVHTYSPVFEYTVNDVTYAHNSNESSSRINFGKGEEVTVKYNPYNPKECYIPEYKSEQRTPYIIIGAGCLFTILGFITLVSN